MFSFWNFNEKYRFLYNIVAGSFSSAKGELRLLNVSAWRGGKSYLASIHPWADGNGRMDRLLMNVVKYEKNLVSSIVKKERRAEYIKVISESQDAEDSASLIDFMFNHHIQNLKQQIEEYKRSL